VIGILAVDGRMDCYIWYSEGGLGGAAAGPGSPSYYSMRHSKGFNN